MEEVWKLLAGIGIFLFGMYLLEESIKMLSGRAFKTFIKNYTNTRFKSILTGTFSTAVLQSSSAVTLIVIAFVGAGMMTLVNAMGVIIGSNLGTTFTSWLVATIGFKFSIESLAMPIIAIGGLGLIFLGKTGKYANLSKLLVGFGFIFLGLDYMKVSVTGLVETIPLEYLKNQNFFVYIFAGFLITGLVQSSSAAVALVLSAVYSGMIGFPEACSMVIGVNVGTTLTVILGTFGGTTAMKRVAFSHFLFNILTAIIAALLFSVIVNLVTNSFDVANDPVTGIAIFHTIFNVLGVVVFTPFVGYIAKLIKKVYPEKKDIHTKFIHATLSEFPEASINAFQKEVNYLIQLSMHHNLKALHIDETLVLKPFRDNENISVKFPIDRPKTYEVIKNLHAELFSYGAKIQANVLNEIEADLINRNLHCVRYAVTSSKTIKDYQHEFDELYNSDKEISLSYYQYFRQEMTALYLKLVLLLEEKDPAVIIPELRKLTDHIKEENRNFNKSIINKLTQKELPEQLVNNVLSAQRGFSQSEIQLIVAMKSFLLNEEDARIYDGFEDVVM
jgi:phosphate:Na+ symporter